MVTPFLNARDFIFQAQNKTDLEEQKLLLQKAFDQLTTATNAVYTDLKTSADHLAKLTIRSFFRNTKQIQNYMNFLALDMQLATKFVGVYMQVLDYLGDNQSVQLISARYQYVLKDFFTKGMPPSLHLPCNNMGCCVREKSPEPIDFYHLPVKVLI